MAEKDEYIREACGELKKLSLDEQKRIEYEQREKAIRDYNSQMHSAERRGEKRGEKLGRQKTLNDMICKLLSKGFSSKEVSDLLELDHETVVQAESDWKSGRAESNGSDSGQPDRQRQ